MNSPAWTVEHQVRSAEELKELARRLAANLRAGDLLVLSGELGAGKTTFTQGLGTGLGVRAGIISPTFVLVRQHPNLGDGPGLVHVDAYRLESAAEIDDLDLEATLDTSITVIEWGAGRVEHLTASRLDVTITRPVGGGLVPGATALAAGGGLAPEAGGLAPMGGFAPEVPMTFDDDADELRHVSITAYGPRWSAGQPASLLLD
ncbi:tRNA (adenosine(37)-N6)-threonylcarbamoyltransferase complex ATPase subunit type 1 TsaE [Arthrobacter sp. H41]|uniref:tRNA (adenosine(37)-N6)-threonylcarbamoyltransferase complex ATPase subunit type 1 TsaE n=1 Tax=Arthrobacter sp. H41 TaxID=1312978 RepID=UPI00047BC67F|nr:tRNA (adenosine(37)-N6)-threonylcarbamoyltransferase complex ATPase subunit type 1 TsaE [Arthrobacter sp. H41]